MEFFKTESINAKLIGRTIIMSFYNFRVKHLVLLIFLLNINCHVLNQQLIERHIHGIYMYHSSYVFLLIYLFNNIYFIHILAQDTDILQTNNYYMTCTFYNHHIHSTTITYILQPSHTFYNHHIHSTTITYILQPSHTFYNHHIHSTTITYIIQPSHTFYNHHIHSNPVTHKLSARHQDSFTPDQANITIHKYNQQ